LKKSVTSIGIFYLPETIFIVFQQTFSQPSSGLQLNRIRYLGSEGGHCSLIPNKQKQMNTTSNRWRIPPLIEEKLLTLLEKNFLRPGSDSH
jgi:hypothetical protein